MKYEHICIELIQLSSLNIIHIFILIQSLLLQQQCDKYWGDVFSMQKYVRHGDVHIWLESTIEMAQLTVRNFRIQRVS